MPGKVFISCGQRPPNEKNIAEKIAKMLKEKFELKCYLAFKIQGLNDIMKITEELRSSDYYLFIDFFRNSSGDELPCSLFTHQEFALAHHLAFKEILAFQQKGAPLEGFLRYVQANPEIFETEEELVAKVESLVRGRQWNANYSRNLVACDLNRIGPLSYGDHAGSYFEWVWDMKIENRRPDVAAIEAACLLDYIIGPDGRCKKCQDRSWLKWGGQIGYQRTILPEDYGFINIFAIHCNESGVFLHSAKDLVPRSPIIVENGEYELGYKLFADHFPVLSFSVRLDYKHTSVAVQPITNFSKATIINN